MLSVHFALLVLRKNAHVSATPLCMSIALFACQIAWYKDGKRIKRSSRYEIKYTQDGYSTLRIRMALPEDAGHYTMLAVNSAGKTTCSSELYVDVVGNIDATSFVAPETLDRILRRYDIFCEIFHFRCVALFSSECRLFFHPSYPEYITPVLYILEMCSQRQHFL